MKNQKLIDRIAEIAEENGWSVNVEEMKTMNGEPLTDGSVDLTFSQYTDAGQDFSFTAEMKEGDIYDLIQNISDYYDGYDPDEEAILWVGPDGHGKNGAPHRISDIVKDMEQCESMIKELLDTLIDTNNKEKLWELADQED